MEEKEYFLDITVSCNDDIQKAIEWHDSQKEGLGALFYGTTTNLVGNGK